MATKKTARKSASKTAEKSAKTDAGRTAAVPARKSPAKTLHSMPKEGRDPRGGLTAKGREYFNKKEGSHLRPGVQGPADTPEKMVRKGSFLRRHFAHPRGPMKNPKGEPTRLALSAHAWGEPVPQTTADAKRLASEGHELLEQYHAVKEGHAAAKKTTSGKKSASKTAAKKGAAAKRSGAKRTTAKSAVAKSTAAKSTGTRFTGRTPAKTQKAASGASAARGGSPRKSSAKAALRKRT